MTFFIKETGKYLLRSKPLINRAICHVDRLYSLQPGELTAYAEKTFLEHFHAAYSGSPYYNRLYRQHGIKPKDIQSLSDLKKLPILTKRMVKENHRAMLISPRWRVVSANTSGTTGAPLTVYHSYPAIRLEQAYNWYRRRRCGFTYGEKLVSLRGHLGQKNFRAFVRPSNTLYLSSYQISRQKASEYHKELVAFEPKAIEGYPSSLYNLALALQEFNLQLEIPFCFTSSETLFAFQRALIERILGTQVFDRYGCTERSISLAERPDHDGYYEEPGYSINEFLPESIVTTSLLNPLFPLIRYQIDDIIERAPCGKIRSILGRNDDVVICRNGEKIGRLDHVLKGVDGVQLAQIVQTNIGSVDINVVPDERYSPDVSIGILRNLRERASEHNLMARVNIIGRDEIIYSSREKFSFVKSLL